MLLAVEHRCVHFQDARMVLGRGARQADEVQGPGRVLGPAPVQERLSLDRVEGRGLQVPDALQVLDDVMSQFRLVVVERLTGASGHGIGQADPGVAEGDAIGDPALQDEQRKRHGKAARRRDQRQPGDLRPE